MTTYQIQRQPNGTDVWVTLQDKDNFPLEVLSLSQAWMIIDLWWKAYGQCKCRIVDSHGKYYTT